MYKGIKVSTNKAVLESCDNPISNLVMSWRKLNTTQTKVSVTSSEYRLLKFQQNFWSI